MSLQFFRFHFLKFFVATITVLLLQIPSTAALSASASLSTNEADLGETVQLIVQVVSDEKIDKLPWPEVGGLEGFTVTKTSGSSTSSQTTIINGRLSQTNNYVTQFSFNIVPTKVGSFTIGPVSYSYNDFSKQLGTAQFSVRVAESGLKLEPKLNLSSGYVGQQVSYQLRIIPDRTVQNISAPNLQQAVGEKFWVQALDKEIKPTVVSISGQDTRVFDIRLALFPLIAGTAKLEGVTIPYQQAKQSRKRRSGSVFDLFEDDFFGAQVVNLTAQASSLEFKAIPLPGNAPQGFSGSVGQFSIATIADRNQLPSGDALTLQVVIAGNGLPSTISNPINPDLAAFEVYDPEIKLDTKLRGTELVSEKKIKYVMVPRRQGDYTIGEYRYIYFDPQSATYKTASSKPITISVSKGKEVESGSHVILAQKDIAEIGSDIRYIHTGVQNLKNQGVLLYQRIWFWFYLPIPLIVLIASFFYRRHTKRLESNSALRRRSYANRHLKKRLQQARSALKDEKRAEFYHSIADTINAFLSDLWNVEFRGLTIEQAKDLLEARNISQELRDQLQSILEECDYGQFSGTRVSLEKGQDLIRKAEEFLTRMEKHK